jgi:hypothetical protein
MTNTLLPTADAALGRASRKLEAADFSTLHIISYWLITRNLLTEIAEIF